jgi:hypothetical protein
MYIRLEELTRGLRNRPEELARGIDLFKIATFSLLSGMFFFIETTLMNNDFRPENNIFFYFDKKQYVTCW